MIGESSITIPDYREATCVELVASLLVMSDFIPHYNCKLLSNIDWTISKISDSNNFITAQFYVDELNEDRISLVSRLGLWYHHFCHRSCLWSGRLFFKIVSVNGTSALTSHLFQKPFIYVLPKSEVILANLTVSSSKTIALLLTEVKSSVSNGLTIKFSNSLFTSSNLYWKPWCLHDAFYT